MFRQSEPVPIKVTKLTARIFQISGDGGNIGLVIADDGLPMIDGGYAGRAAELQKVIAGLSSQPVRILFNTHWHPDHVGSNEVLGRAGVKIIAHRNTTYWLGRQVKIESLNSTVEPLKAEGLPVQTFTDGGKMNFGQEKIEYKWVPNSHTCTDAYLFLPSANVLHTGDLFFNGIYPVIDYTTGGWIGGMATALDWPGHKRQRSTLKLYRNNRISPSPTLRSAPGWRWNGPPRFRKRWGGCAYPVFPGGGFAAPKVARGLAYGDFDRDGDLDLPISTNQGPAHLYRNDVAPGVHGLRLQLIGTKSNRGAIGSVVRLTTADGTQSRTVKTGSSYLSQSELTLTFGLGPRDSATRIVVEWASGAVQEFTTVAAGAYECTEGGRLSST